MTDTQEVYYPTIAHQDGLNWIEPPWRESANRRRIRKWLAANPEVRVGAEQMLDLVYECSDTTREARRYLGEFLALTERWLGAHLGASIEGYDAWMEAMAEEADAPVY